MAGELGLGGQFLRARLFGAEHPFRLRLQPLLIRQTGSTRIFGSAGAAFDDGLVRDWPQPGLDVDKHRGYAFQWYAMAVATAALWGWFAVWRPLRTRSRRRDDKTGSGAA